MTSAATITDEHAAGITASKGRVGGVVDQLLAEAPEQIVQIPINLIENHPRNRKVHPDDVADMVAGIKEVGVINPAVVATGAAYNAGRLNLDKEIDPTHYVIVGGGHRRKLAAAEAGLTLLPCVIRDDLADAKGRKTALLENLHRRALDPFEEAAAFRELKESYGVTQQEIADAVGVTQPQVGKRLKLLKLPSTVRAMVNLGKLTIGDALDLARVADDEKLTEAALLKITEWRWSAKQAVDHVLDEAKRDKKRAEAILALEAEQVKVTTSRPSFYLHTKTATTELKSIGISEAKHRKETCHAAYVNSNGAVDLVCTTPGRHLPDGASKVNMPKPKQEQLTRSTSSGGMASRNGKTDAEERRDRAALKKQIPARMEIAGMITVGTHTLDERAESELIRHGAIGMALGDSQGRSDVWSVVRALKMCMQAAESYPSAEVRHKLLTKQPHDWTMLAIAVAYFEGRVRPAYVTWGEEQRYWLNLLASQGYEISDVEHEKLGDKRQGDQWLPAETGDNADDEPPFDVTSCRTCGCTDAEACEGGCSWVEADLCSTCSAAIEAGLVTADQPLVDAAAG